MDWTPGWSDQGKFGCDSNYLQQKDGCGMLETIRGMCLHLYICSSEPYISNPKVVEAYAA